MAKVISEFFMVISQCFQKMGDRTTKNLCLKNQKKVRKRESKNYSGQLPSVPPNLCNNLWTPCNRLEGSTGNTADNSDLSAPNFHQARGFSVFKRWEINPPASWF